ncbi:helix-turn-helix domain-containing protein [Streptomyces sp. 3MP-14]|uniref:Helix-turn-helix domain-containing protein n=1 Tax=Streptomyces mimosae TaxID=2586635 RepID=A0A5N6AAE0_9ACTN|nr:MULTISPECIES: helix-turn-helix transcriptional regulator [Streptomyces]KAB8165787.1 helix-turn-helix domain-containing protein [Streptomyces mimosae]KAB8176176.1 helix-turn-helix domain-containing protein [Streptomyces sp. 3MP-14]
MEQTHSETERATPRTYLGRRLRRMRESAGLSLRALSEAVGFPFSYIARVERGEQLPSALLCDALDTYFGSDDLFAELLEMAQDSAIADYSRVVLETEEKASRIQVFHSSLVHGLLQTEAYARALIDASSLGKSPEQRAQIVALRMRRKRVFALEEPPYFWAIMDEAAFKRPIGGREVMREQMAHLIEAAQSPHITIQVLPFAQGAHPMLGGSLSLYTLRNGSTIGYIESFVTGEPVESPRRIVESTQRFDIARSKALPESESLALMQAYLREYENEVDS